MLLFSIYMPKAYLLWNPFSTDFYIQRVQWTCHLMNALAELYPQQICWYTQHAMFYLPARMQCDIYQVIS